jgi:hypothetical protein
LFVFLQGRQFYQGVFGIGARHGLAVVAQSFLRDPFRVCKAIADFGFDSKEYSPDFFQTPSSILMIGREPWHIDIFTSIKGLDFVEAYKKRVYFKVNRIQIPFVDRGDMIRSKEASKRNRDRDDIKRLNAKQETKSVANKSVESKCSLI